LLPFVSALADIPFLTLSLWDAENGRRSGVANPSPVLLPPQNQLPAAARRQPPPFAFHETDFARMNSTARGF
jgi:hypothetical protein